VQKSEIVFGLDFDVDSNMDSDSRSQDLDSSHQDSDSSHHDSDSTISDLNSRDSDSRYVFRIRIQIRPQGFGFEKIWIREVSHSPIPQYNFQNRIQTSIIFFDISFILG
jgi:hypothetical protein